MASPSRLTSLYVELHTCALGQKKESAIQEKLSLRSGFYYSIYRSVAMGLLGLARGAIANACRRSLQHYPESGVPQHGIVNEGVHKAAEKKYNHHHRES